jgi:glutamine---fructose-6-phosphate transaminase (isomerizing)
MCGISVFISKNNRDILIKLLASLHQLQNRGYDSAGIAYIDTDNLQVNIVKFASTKEEDSLKNLNHEIMKNNIESFCALGHTRWATHGGKTQINSHPHLSYNNKIVLIHNGIIENYLELKNFLKEKDYVFKSETDTEVIANLIEYYYLSDDNITIEKAIKIACKKMSGTWALAIINTEDLESVYIIRNGSPLLIGDNESLLICTSEVSGFCNNVSNYIRLENNNLLKIKNGIINDRNKIVSFLTVENNIDTLNCEPYNHWTLKEIFEQPKSIMRAFNNGGRIHNNIVKLGGLNYLLPHLNKIDNIILLGCGTSLHACMLGKYYFHENTEYNVSYYDAGEFIESFIPKYEKNIIIYCSQSGETRDLYKNIELSSKYNCINLGIINVIDSQIANAVHCGVYMNAGREVAVASTKSFTSTLIILSLISILFSQNTKDNINNINNINTIQNLRNLSNQIDSMLYDKIFTKKCEKIRDKILEVMKNSNNNSMFILGKGKMFPIAKEAALKIKEITYIHAEGYSGGALKHGPFALLDENSIVILLIDEKNNHSMFNTYEEIKSRGAYCFIVSELDCEIYIGNEFTIENRYKTYTLTIPNNSSYQEILAIVALQYLAYIISISKGINPDRPKNLAKVVTVD